MPLSPQHKAPAGGAQSFLSFAQAGTRRPGRRRVVDKRERLWTDRRDGGPGAGGSGFRDRPGRQHGRRRVGGRLRRRLRGMPGRLRCLKDSSRLDDQALGVLINRGHDTRRRLALMRGSTGSRGSAPRPRRTGGKTRRVCRQGDSGRWDRVGGSQLQIGQGGPQHGEQHGVDEVLDQPVEGGAKETRGLVHGGFVFVARPGAHIDSGARRELVARQGDPAVGSNLVDVPQRDRQPLRVRRSDDELPLLIGGRCPRRRASPRRTAHGTEHILPGTSSHRRPQNSLSPRSALYNRPTPRHRSPPT